MYYDVGLCSWENLNNKGIVFVPPKISGDLKIQNRTSLVAQWVRILLPMQGTRVRALVWEDPTCRRATKPMRHNY